MTLLNPKARTERGHAQQETLLGKTAAEPATLFQSSWRDYIFAEVWTRDGLDLRSRYLISIASVAESGVHSERLNDYVRGALLNDSLSQLELREAALHCAIYGGWDSGTAIDKAIDFVLTEQGIEAQGYDPIRAEPWDPQERLQKGAAEFHNVMTFGGPPPVAPYFEGGILNFVFGEVWHRPGLDQRGRRWLTLVGVANSSADIPIRTHIYGAMASGNASYEEMNEFVLQYAVHAGWPRASYVQGVVFEMAEKVKKNLTWDGKPKE
ncbi:carboxymuconolactone decarboxylase family protein [Aestuariicella hydrocarbonica]|uniref:Carboxymuconolactone decarboxylase family protein n=2 Tax=Pseudomaricurvus hydrocarbonicus TaxID=1470433 RepID=A0A9E5MNH1_9GAMM|nr:carboxymuconolactone decarboxylase family protein [Aestuariicella hydrocarbonica]NHO67422.1 carboxymuconolactone decarboxylase family protein [Aestuariicella hydrocarbonica]